MNDSSLDHLFSVLKETNSSGRSLSDNTSNTDNTVNKNNTDNHDKTNNMKYANNNSNPQNKSEVRFCTIVDEDILLKIRSIARREGLQIKDVVGAAFSKAIAIYEANNGEITGDGRGDIDSLF